MGLLGLLIWPVDFITGGKTDKRVVIVWCAHDSGKWALSRTMDGSQYDNWELVISLAHQLFTHSHLCLVWTEIIIALSYPPHSLLFFSWCESVWSFGRRSPTLSVSVALTVSKQQWKVCFVCWGSEMSHHCLVTFEVTERWPVDVSSNTPCLNDTPFASHIPAGWSMSPSAFLFLSVFPYLFMTLAATLRHLQDFLRLLMSVQFSPNRARTLITGYTHTHTHRLLYIAL